MGGKRDNKIIIVPLLIFFIFLFGIIGYKESMGSDFSISGSIYSTLFFFILNNIDPKEASVNIYLLIARYLAAIMLGFGIYSLLYKHIYAQYIRLKLKYKYRNHVIVFSIKMVCPSFFSDLLANKYQVVLVEDQSKDPYMEKAEKDGIVVFREEELGIKLFEIMRVSHARACVIAYDDDDRNIELSLKLVSYLRSKGHKKNVRMLAHISNNENLEVIKDYVDVSNADDNFEYDVFNIYNAAARKIYDNFPPHTFFNFKEPDVENAIAIVGYNAAAEDFIIENIVLSHYKDCKNIKIYLVGKDADSHLNHFLYKYPFCREFAEIVPVKLLNNKFFANFNWSKELIEKLSKVKVAYFFGDSGSELMNVAARFRQFLSGQTENYLLAPIVICYPEDTAIMSLLDVERENAEKLSNVFRKQLNISFVNMISDTCTSSRLLDESEYIDMLSRVINYYYSIKYEFEWVLKDQFHLQDVSGLVNSIEDKLLNLPEKHTLITEQSIEKLVLLGIAEYTKKTENELKQYFSIKKWWEHLSYHKKSANRYAARHLSVKLSVMEQIGCVPLNRENIIHAFPVIAPIEHKRWCAEKMVLNYRFGTLPQDRKAKNAAKEILKIHDQLIPYDKLSEPEKEKDLNIFLLMPLLNSLKAEIKK